jgi:hypothetical protein
MLRSRHRGRGALCWLAEIEPIVGSRWQVFSVDGFPSAGFGVHRMVAEGISSEQKLLDLREKGVYSSYTHMAAKFAYPTP